MKTINQRLNNIVGQISGVKKMIAEGDDCIKVLTQMKAVKSAMTAVMDQMMVDEFDRCLKSVSTKDKNLLIKVKKYVQSN